MSPTNTPTVIDNKTDMFLEERLNFLVEDWLDYAHSEEGLNIPPLAPDEFPKARVAAYGTIASVALLKMFQKEDLPAAFEVLNAMQAVLPQIISTAVAKRAPKEES